MDLTQNKSTGVLNISGALDIDTGDALRDALLERLTRSSEVAVDFSQVDKCDAAGLQVLLAARHDAETTGKKFRVIAASEAVTDLAVALGFQLAAPSEAVSGSADGL